jgi:glycosyltransferase involved in cell wall biosynthesis
LAEWGLAVSTAPFCSVIVPTYDRSRALRACLESLGGLDYPRDRYEVVVVNDGGGDSLDAVLDPWRGKLNVTLVSQPRSGPAAARNAGVACAGGELIAFTDDDCRVRPDWLRRLAERWSLGPEEAVGGRTVNALPRNAYSTAAQLIIDVGYRQNNTGSGDRRWFTTNNLAVSAEGFHAVAGFDPSFKTAEDRDFCSRWLADGLRMGYEPQAVVEHAHELTLRSFVGLNFAYGRGAFHYHDRQRRRGRPVPIEPSFYAALARAPLEDEGGRRLVALEALLVIWHVSNTAGFLWEWGRSSVDGARART